MRSVTLQEIPDKIMDLFWNRLVPDGECLLYVGPTRGNNHYGSLNFTEHYALTHRLSYEYFFGPIPPKMKVCHTCDRPICVAPWHLFLGTHQQNMQDMVIKKRYNLGPANAARRKLTDLDVLMALDLRMEGVSRTKVARIFNVSPAAIRWIELGVNHRRLVV